MIAVIAAILNPTDFAEIAAVGMAVPTREIRAITTLQSFWKLLGESRPIPALTI
jgi:hypothetical protein